jgi:hypothetical protein
MIVATTLPKATDIVTAQFEIVTNAQQPLDQTRTREKKNETARDLSIRGDILVAQRKRA